MHKIPIDLAIAPIFSESGREVYILSGDITGKYNIMTASWCMKVAINPQVLWAVSIKKDRFTAQLVNASKEFVIAFPKKGDSKLVEEVGSCHGDKVDKFKEYGLKVIRAKKVRVPLLMRCVGNLGVNVGEIMDCGSHYLYIGEAVEAWEADR